MFANLVIEQGLGFADAEVRCSEFLEDKCVAIRVMAKHPT